VIRPVGNGQWISQSGAALAIIALLSLSVAAHGPGVFL
jgi:hypothetical protein